MKMMHAMLDDDDEQFDLEQEHEACNRTKAFTPVLNTHCGSRSSSKLKLAHIPSSGDEFA